MDRKFLRFVVWTALILGSLGGLARAFLVRPWVVPTGDANLAASIAPTLEAGDLVLLWRFTSPKYGDLVVCEDPDDKAALVVGRLLAEAGDHIVVNGENVTLNGERSATETACDKFTVLDPNTDQEIEQLCSLEALSGQKQYMGRTAGHQNVPVPVQEEVLDGEAYLVSDNRLYPYDSRTYGPLLRATCKESVVFRLVGPRGWADAKRRLTSIL